MKRPKYRDQCAIQREGRKLAIPFPVWIVNEHNFAKVLARRQCFSFNASSVKNAFRLGVDGKTLYISTSTGANDAVWTADADGTRVQKLLDECCQVVEASRDGKRLLALMLRGENPGIYQIRLKENRVIPLVRGAAQFGAHYAPDGKSVLYPVASNGRVSFYRQLIDGEKPIGQPQVALTLPFTFPLAYNGNAFDFSSDLSTIVYARPGGQANIYLLSRP